MELGIMPSPLHRLPDRMKYISFTMSSVALLLLICTHTASTARTINKNEAICLTPACVHAASEILYSLSPEYKNIDPCVDFDEFVCGGWEERHDLRPDQGDVFTGTIMSESSQTLLRHVLESPYPENSSHSRFSPLNLMKESSSIDRENFGKLKDAYEACMDEEAVKKLGSKPLTNILGEVQKRFPLVASQPIFSPQLRHQEPLQRVSDNRLTETILFLMRNGVNSILSLGVGADDKDPDTVIIQVSPPRSIGLPSKEYYNNTSVMSRYQRVVSHLLAQVGGLVDAETSDSSRKLAKEVVDFETRLAEASPNAEDADDVTKYYNIRSLKETGSLLPELSFSHIIKNLAPAGYEPDRLIVSSPSYLKILSKTLRETSAETIQAFFIWKTIQRYASYVDLASVKPYIQFRNELQGKDPNASEERWRTCVKDMDNGLGWILSRFFVEKAFSESARQFGDRIVSDIKTLFIEKLKETKWMEKDVVELAIEKVHNIVQKIGYPTKSPNILDPSALKKFYSPIKVSTITYFDNELSFAAFDVLREWSALGKPTDRNEWGMTVPTVNAYYNPAGNEIVFPAGIMQFPVFDVNVPEYISYGAFGSVSGHELSHAFDSTGRHYDQNGNYTDWWTNHTVAAFEEKAACFVSQYANYTVPGPDDKPLHVNGKLTLGENIADAGGLTAAFAAWKRRETATPGQSLPGLEEFSKEQLFFMAYSNWWCGKTRKETAITRIYQDPHAPKWARILGTMANSRDFAESFNCPKKEPVCELW